MDQLITYVYTPEKMKDPSNHSSPARNANGRFTRKLDAVDQGSIISRIVNEVDAPNLRWLSDWKVRKLLRALPNWDRRYRTNLTDFAAT